jgi:Protein of unknown function (DUF2917)
MAAIGPISLLRGNVVRILRGQGTRVMAARGALWVSEEGSPMDYVLMPGDAVTLQHGGKALVQAVSAARAFLETPHGVAPPRVVEIAPADGMTGRRIRGHAGPAQWIVRAAREVIAWIDSALGFARGARVVTRSPVRRA